MTDKEIAADIVERMPRNGSLTAIIEELQAVVAARQGQADVAAGRVRRYEEVKELLPAWVEQWTTKNRATK